MNKRIFLDGPTFMFSDNHHKPPDGALLPLPERRRPKGLEDFIGQNHIAANGRIIRSIIEKNSPFSLILWGEPGTGKTTLASIIAHECNMASHFLSAISAGVADVRKVINEGKKNISQGVRTLLFLDEIHRFNKAQQDTVLGAVEAGEIVLIGATTENPSFSIISPLLSRARVLKLKPLGIEELKEILHRAINEDLILKELSPVLGKGVDEKIASMAGGDARRLLNILETAVQISRGKEIGEREVAEAVSQTMLYYDRQGDRHYDTISAFIKSLRGSDPDAALFYLARMILSGEDPVFIARRMVIFASEDIGNAVPQALPFAVSAMTAVQNTGMPEAEIILAHCTTFLASSPKSNASYIALKMAKEAAVDEKNVIPMHLRNAPTKLMKNMGYGKDYRYPHDYPGNFIKENYLPENIKDSVFYRPGENGNEKGIKERLLKLWAERYRDTDKQA